MPDKFFSKNVLIAMVLAMGIMIIWDYVIKKETPNAPQITNTKNESTATNNADIAQAPENLELDRNKAFHKNTRVTLNNKDIEGSISLKGGRIDDISLIHYKEDLSKNSPDVRIFDLKNTANAYYFQSGWIAVSNALILPDSNTIWHANKKHLDTSEPLVLSWVNPQGIIFKKIISIDDSFMISVKDVIKNPTSKEYSVHPYGYILRYNDPKVQDLFISHEGFVGNLDSTLERVNYGDVLDKPYDYETKGGYAGFTDKYWLSAIILDKTETVKASFLSFKDSKNINNYQTKYTGNSLNIGANSEITSHVYVFVGPKAYNVIHNFDAKYKIGKFDDTIDFGWFFFFTKPMIKFLLWIYHLVGNFGIAMLIFTIVIRAIILPIAYKSYVSMAKMKELQPKMKALKAMYKDDLQKYNKELMALYKKEHVNPLSGCLPILLQIPIFFSIYKVIFVSIELRHAPFFGWVKDMSAADPTNIFELFGLLPWDAPHFLHIGLWPILMGVSMYFQQQLSATNSLDPLQQKIMNLMPVVLVFVLSAFPVGLVIYWTWSNILSIIQQLIINKRVHNEFGLRKKKPKILKKKTG
ncbi:Membrane protein insertase YidC [Candidatus Hepatincola sp. Av]